MNKVFKISILLILAFALCTSIIACAPEETTPPPVEVVEPTLSESSLTLKTGEQRTLTVKDAGELSVTWLSTSPSVATVESGVVTARAKGVAVIKAKLGETELECVVEVKMIDATVLILDSNGIKSGENETALYLDQKYAFYPELIEGGSSVSLDNVTVTYHTSDEEVVKIEDSTSSEANVSAKKVGLAYVWASCNYGGKVYVSHKIKVTVKLSTELVLSKDSFTFVTNVDLQGNSVNEGASDRVYVSYRKLDTNEVIDVSKEDIVYKVEDESVATVDRYGNITGKSAGKTKIKVMTEFGEDEIDVAVSYPIFSAKDLDYIALATYNLSLTKATELLSSSFILMNDIDYSSHERNFMLPIASLVATDASQTSADLFLDRDVQKHGEEYGGFSYYSKTWLDLLDLREGTVDMTTKDVKRHEDASEDNPVTFGAKVLLKANGDRFEGINPSAIKFTGTIDGNGYSIKNAWLMLDNYLMSGGFTWLTSIGPAYMSGFIGYQSGTVKNLEFDNLTIGDVQTVSRDGKYFVAERKGNYGSYLGTIGAMYSTLGESNQQSLTVKVESRDAVRYLTERVTVGGKERAEDFRRDVVLYSYRNERESSANALFIKNEGTIENVKMNYIATGSVSDGNDHLRADGLVLVNDGMVKNVVIEREVYVGQYVVAPKRGRSVCYLNRANGKIENVYLTTNGIGSDLPYNTKGYWDVTECLDQADLSSSVSGFDSNIWDGASLKKGCALDV